MADTNITVVGNLTREPELRFTNGGKGVASFGIAVSRRYQVNGEWQEKTSFFNVSAWDNLGENVAATLTKGMRVIVSGRLEVREYEAREGGKRATVERTERSDGGQGGGGNYGGGGGQGGQRGGSSSGGQRPSDSVYGDEEPF
jgi:single-strand DNA-binding protein